MSVDTKSQPSRLQQVVRQAIADSGKARDHFDRLLQIKLKTTGKPLFDIERGKSKNPSGETLLAIAEVFGLPLSYFTGETSPAAPDIPPTLSADGGEMVEIEKLDLSLSMGPGTLIDDYVEATPVKFDLAFIRAITRSPPGRLKLVTGIGRSMEPTLQDGDVILIDTTDRQLARIDGIYWISIYGASGIKRLRAIGPNRVRIISDNKTIESEEVDASDLRIEGRAIWAARGL